MIRLPGGADLLGREDVQGRLEKPVDERRLEAVLRTFCPSAPATAPTVQVVEDDDDTRDSIPGSCWRSMAIAWSVPEMAPRPKLS